MLFCVINHVSFEVKTLLYTSYYSFYNPADCFLDPFFNFFGRIVGILGYIFICVGVSLLSLQTVLQYVIYLPLVLRTLDPIQILAHAIIGHWILINLVFNYYKCLTTSPGTPPNDSRSAKQIIGVCKKCIAPKPPRAHHCSVCKKCVLKMDHHCPWINNCVGHLNHRYFFSLIVYLFIGALYVLFNGTVYFQISWSFTRALRVLRQHRVRSNDWLGSAVSFQFGLALVSTVPVGFLLLQQLKLILFGETIIEQYTNVRERHRCKTRNQVFRNIYDYGWKNNFLLFYGISSAEYQKGWSWLKMLLLPSNRLPIGDGLSWFPPDAPRNANSSIDEKEYWNFCNCLRSANNKSLLENVIVA